MRRSTSFRSSTLFFLPCAPSATSFSSPLLPVSCRFAPSLSCRMARLLLLLLVIRRDSYLLTNFSFFPFPPPPSAAASHTIRSLSFSSPTGFLESNAVMSFFVGVELVAAAAAPPPPLLGANRDPADSDVPARLAAGKETRVSEGETAAAGETPGISTATKRLGGRDADEGDVERIAAASETAAEVAGDETATEGYEKTTSADGEGETQTAGQTAKGGATTFPAPSTSKNAAALSEERFEKAAEESTLDQGKSLGGPSEGEMGQRREVRREQSKETNEEIQDGKTNTKSRSPLKKLIVEAMPTLFEDKRKKSYTRPATHTQHLQKTEPAAAEQEEVDVSSVAGKTSEPLGREEEQSNEEEGDRLTGETSTDGVRQEKEENEKKEGGAESKKEALLEEGIKENRQEGHKKRTPAKEHVVEGEEENGGAGKAKGTEGTKEEEEVKERGAEKGRDEGVMGPEEGNEKREAAKGEENQSEAGDQKKEKVETERQLLQGAGASVQKEAIAQQKNTQHAETQKEQHAGVLKTATGKAEIDARLQLRGGREAEKGEGRKRGGKDEETQERDKEAREVTVFSQETEVETVPQKVPGETAMPQEMQEEEERQDTQNPEIQPQRVELQRFTDEEMKRIIEYLIKEELKTKEQLVEQDAEALDAEDKVLDDQSGVPDSENEVARDDRTEMPVNQKEEKGEAADEATSHREIQEKQSEALNQHTLAAAEVEVGKEEVPGKQHQEEKKKEIENVSREEEGARAHMEEKEAERRGEKQRSTEKEAVDDEEEEGESAEAASDQEKQVREEKETDELLKQQQETRESLVQQRNQALQELNSVISSLAAIAGRFESQQIQLEEKQQLGEQQSYPEKGEAQVQEWHLKENEDSLMELLQKHERVLRWMGDDNQRSLEDVESSLIPNLQRFGDISMNREELLQYFQETQRLINTLTGAAERFRAILNKLNECRRAFLRDHDRALQIIYEYGRAVDLLNIEVEEKKLSNEEIEERFRACSEAFDVLSMLMGTCDERVVSVMGLTGALEVMHGLSIAYIRQVIEMHDKKEAAHAVTDQNTATADLTGVAKGDMSEAADIVKDENGEKKFSDVYEEPTEVSLKPGQLQITSYAAALQNERRQLLEAARRAVDILARLGRSVIQATGSVVKTRVRWLENLSTQLMKHFDSLVQAGELLRSREEERPGQEANEEAEEGRQQQGQAEEEVTEDEAKSEEQEEEEQEEDDDESEEEREEAEGRARESPAGRRSRYLVRKDEEEEEFAQRIGKGGEVYEYPRKGERRRRTGRWRLPGWRGRKTLLGDRYYDELEDEVYEEAFPTQESFSGEIGQHKRRNRLAQLRHLQIFFRRHADDAAGQCVGRAETDLLVDINSEGWKAIQLMAEGTQFDNKLALEVREAIEKEIRTDSTTVVLGSLLGIALLLLFALLLYGYYMVFAYQKRINAYKFGNEAGETTEKIDEGVVSAEGGTPSRGGTIRRY